MFILVFDAHLGPFAEVEHERLPVQVLVCLRIVLESMLMEREQLVMHQTLRHRGILRMTICHGTAWQQTGCACTPA